MRLGHDALAVGGRRQGSVEGLDETGHLGVCSPGTAAGDDQRTLRRADRFGRPGHDMFIESGAAARERDRHAAVPCSLEYVEGNLDVHGSGTGRVEHGERLGDGLRSSFGGAGALGGHEKAIEGARGVLRLVQHSDVCALEPGGHTGGEDEHRPGLGIGGRGGGDDVRQARTRGRDDDPGLAGDEEVPVGPVACSLLVAGSHGTDPELRQMPVELEIMGAGDAEDRVDTVGGQGGHHGTTAVADGVLGAHGQTPRAVPDGPEGAVTPLFSAAHRDRTS